MTKCEAQGLFERFIKPGCAETRAAARPGPAKKREPVQYLSGDKGGYAMPKVYEQKSGKLTENDRFELVRLLGKAGYAVRIGRERPGGRQSGAWVYFVEYRESWNDDRV